MSKYKKDDIILVRVTNIVEYGFFVRTEDGYTGLCHISEVSNDFVDDIKNYVHDQEMIYVQVLDVDYENKQMRLSIKDIYYKTEEDPSHIVESRKGFLSLKNMLPIWIETKLDEYNKK